MRSKLAAFVVGLALVFGLGYGAGSFFDLGPAPAQHDTHGIVDR